MQKNIASFAETIGWLAALAVLLAFLSFAKLAGNEQRKPGAASSPPNSNAPNVTTTPTKQDRDENAQSPDDFDHPADPKSWHSTIGRGHDRSTNFLSGVLNGSWNRKPFRAKAQGNQPARVIPPPKTPPQAPIDEGNPPAEIDAATKHAIRSWFAANEPDPFETVWFGATKRDQAGVVRWELEYRRGILLTKRIFFVAAGAIKSTMAVEVIEP